MGLLFTSWLNRNMTYEEAKDCIDSISYKKDWEVNFDMMESSPGYRIVIVSRAFPSVKDPSINAAVKNMSILKESALVKMKKQDLIRMIGLQLQEMEIHEFQEWFKYRNKNVYDPHPVLK